jgi:hypothetical protein
MKIVHTPVLAAASVLLATTVQDGYAWAPRTLFTSKTTTPARRKLGSFYLPDYRSTPPLSASVEEQQARSSSSSDEEDSTVKAILSGLSTKILGEPIPYSELTIGVLKEVYPGENRVSQTPDSVKNLVKAGFTVIVQSGGA